MMISPNNSRGVLSPPTMTLSSTNEKCGNQDDSGKNKLGGIGGDLKPPNSSAINRGGSFSGGLQYLQTKRGSAKDTNIRLTENHNTNHVV